MEFQIENLVSMIHKPVLLKEVLKYLDPKPNENFIDCTIGEGGHAIAFLEKNGPEGKVLGIDLDQQQIENCKNNLIDFKDRIILINDSYANLKDIVEKNNFKKVSGILLDLGMSTEQLKESGRGFTFLKDEPLDMRYNRKIQNSNFQIQNELTADKIVNEWSERDIERILTEYGEEKFARQIAKKIIEERQAKRIGSTFQLADIIKKAVPAKYQRAKINCATRTFQALRIAVNGELENLINVLPQAISVLSSGGRIAIISFHSLEDRIVKNFFKQKAEEKIIDLLIKKPATAQEGEVGANPASRSAKLRAAVKIT